MPKLAEALGVKLTEVITALWHESIGDPCPCGCGGTKIAPDTPRARKLLIEIPCANCGKSRTRKQGNWRFHIDQCRKCIWGAVLFRCVGVDDHGRQDWAKTCPHPHELLLLPFEVREYQKAQKPPHGPFNLQPRFIDEANRTLRCPRCAHAAMIKAVTDARIYTTIANTSEVGRAERIRSRKKRVELLSRHIREINPAFIKAGGAAAGEFKTRLRSGEARRNIAISNVVKGWTKPPMSTRMWLCVLCDKLTFDTKRPSKFHRPCYLAWLKTP